MDSIIFVHENIYSLTKYRKEGFLLKLDLSKVYDRVDWEFLSYGLEAFGFNKRFLDLIPMLVSSQTFSILIMGLPLLSFMPPKV